jgi:lipopolysaccharide transport system ATP-binding protein
MASITVTDASVRFPLYDAWSRSFKRRFARATVGQGLAAADGDKVYIEALSNITLAISAGDRVAVLGGNGSGKTSLLRVLGGMLAPTSGSVNIDGRSAAILDTGFGFDPSASAYDTIVLRSILAGKSQPEIRSVIESIAAFSELNSELDSPIRNLTPGHIFRLGTGLAFFLGTDIVLYDEVFEAGSPDFVVKTKDHILSDFPDAGIVIVVERSRAILEDLCNKAIIIEKGRILDFDSFGSVMARHGPAYTI